MLQKVFLDGSFYYYLKNGCIRFCPALTGNHFHPSPPSVHVTVNWDGT